MCLKPMENHWFCMISVWILCPIDFTPSYLGLVLSLRDVESRRRSWCPEIASDYFALTFSVSRGPFGIFALTRPAAGLNFSVLRCPAAVWPSNVVDEHLGGAPPGLGVSERTSGHRRRDRELLVCLYIPRGTNDFHGFSSRFAFGRFVFSDALNTPKRRSRRPGPSGRSRRRSGHASSRSRPSSPSRRQRRPSRSRREFDF